MSIPHLDHISAMAQQARLDAMGIADQITQCGATRHDAYRRTPEQIERLCQIRDTRILTAEFLEALADNPAEVHEALASIGKKPLRRGAS